MYTVQVKQNLVPPIAKVAVGGSLTCLQPTIVLSNQSMTGIPPQAGYPTNKQVVVFLWEGPGVSPPPPTSTYTAFVSGVYTLTVVDMNNGCKSKTTTYVAENKLVPLINFPVSPAPGNICGNITTATLMPTIATPTANLSYSWSAPANALITGVNSLYLVTNMVGEYTINVRDNSNGCSSSQTMQVVQCVGINNTRMSEMKFFPNPARDFLYFSSEIEECYELYLYDATGRLLIKTTLFAKDQVNIEQLEKGIYFLNVMQDGKVKSIIKVQKI